MVERIASTETATKLPFCIRDQLINSVGPIRFASERGSYTWVSSSYGSRCHSMCGVSVATRTSEKVSCFLPHRRHSFPVVSFFIPGVRYNAEKKQVGNYFSTRIYEFSMKCHICSNRIVVTTDPKTTQYIMTSGARAKVMASHTPRKAAY